MRFKSNRSFSRFIHFLTHPALFVIPFSIIIWLLIPGIHQKFQCIPVSAKTNTDDVVYSYADLDNDGVSELLRVGYDQKRAFCTIGNKTDAFMQFNFDGIWPHIGFRCLAGDIDNDNKSELFFFNCLNDSLFLYHRNPNIARNDEVSKTFITVIGQSEKLRWDVPAALLADLTGDGIKEVVFLVAAGFQLRPRQLFAYNTMNKSLMASVDFGTQARDIIPFKENGHLKLAISNYASGNYSDTSLPMTDHYSYRIILNEKLQFDSPPVPHSGSFCQYYLQPLIHNGDTKLLSMVYGEKSHPEHYLLTVTNLDGDTLASKKVSNNREYRSFVKEFKDQHGNSKIVIFKQPDSLVICDHLLHRVAGGKKSIQDIIWNFPDLNLDGKNELLFIGQPGQAIILSEDLKHETTVQIPNVGNFTNFQVIKRGKNPPHFMAQTNEALYYFEYTQSNFFLRWGVLAAIYISILAFTLLIRKLQRNQLKRKYETRQMISELKLMAIHNQIEPHFTFNILNTIGAVMLQNRTEESYQILVKFSKMLRSTLNCDSIVRTLGEELDFVTNYLELQKVRFKDNLRYILYVEQQIDKETVIPKMAIHTYVENAIKHGILQRMEGTIDINISGEPSYLIIQITDNGVGRAFASANGTDSTGRGHKIMHQFYDHLNQINPLPITEKILDLVTPEGDPAGTEVILKIPVNLRLK